MKIDPTIQKLVDSQYNVNESNISTSKNIINDQLSSLDTKSQEMIESQLLYIRRMSMMTDEQIKIFLAQQILKHPHIKENFTEEEQKKMNHDFNIAAKNIKSNPLKLARKVA